MNTSPDHEPSPQWSYKWNHMALPTFGFIFAVPDPPPDLHLPLDSQKTPTPTTYPTSASVEGTVKTEDIPPRSESSQHAVARLQSRRQRKSESDKRLKQTSQPHVKQSWALQGGNSDPFSAAGIAITPQVNQVLTFARDVCLPAFYLVDSLQDSSISAEFNRDVANSSGWISSPAARLGWQQVVDSLSDKCTALACLSTYLALMAMCGVNPAKATEASLKMRAGSSALLRQGLLRKRPTVKGQQELLWQVFWHFYAEFFAGNMIAAQVHGKMLRQLCETAEEGVVTNHFLDSVIFVDSHLAAKYLIRPVLDIETWVPNVYKSTWRKVDTHIYKITGESEEKLHPTVAPQCLRGTFVRKRQAIVLLHRSEEAKVYEIDFETIYYWLNSHSYVDSGILIDRYLTLVEEAMALPTSSASLEISDQLSESLGTIYTQTALCLAALFAIRDIGQEVRINGVDVVDASTTIVKHLKQAIEQALTHCTPDERVKYRAAHLWCAFVGALSEQRLALPTEIDPLRAMSERKRFGLPMAGSRSTLTLEQPEPRLNVASTDASDEHFNHLLAEIAYSMGLISWQQVCDVLQHFIYTDQSEPHGSYWFWKTMGAYLDRRRLAVRQAEGRRRADVTSATDLRAAVLEQPLSLGGSPISSAHVQTQTEPSEHRRWSTVTLPGRSTPTGQRRGVGTGPAEHAGRAMLRTHSHSGASAQPPGQQQQRRPSGRQEHG